MADYYDILGVEKHADEKEIRQAFRRLARNYHPDLNPGDEAAEEKFKSINEAYEVLSELENRRKYDKYGENWRHADQIESQMGGSSFGWTRRQRRSGGTSGPDPFGGFGDLFGGLDDIVGRGGRTATPRRFETSVEVTLEEAFQGTKRTVTISEAGKDRRIEVSMPAGVDTGSVVRITPGANQELLLNITVAPHRRFKRTGTDLETEVQVPLEVAILGGEVDVSTLTGTVRLKVPSESQNGQRIRLGGQGMARLGKDDTRGNLFVKLRPVMPKDLTDEQKELVRKLLALRSKEKSLQ